MNDDDELTDTPVSVPPALPGAPASGQGGDGDSSPDETTGTPGEDSSRGLTGEEFRRTWKRVRSANAAAQRNRRGQWPPRSNRTRYTPGQNRRDGTA